MELYVKEKDNKFSGYSLIGFSANCCNQVVYSTLLNIENQLNIKSLEQHDRELLESNKNKDKRIAELEEELASQNSNEVVKKKYDSLKEAIKFLWEKQITDEHIFYVIDQLGQQHIDRIQDIENGICKIERLEKELAELKENAIVPKFKVGDKVRTRNLIPLIAKELGVEWDLEISYFTKHKQLIAILNYINKQATQS